MHATGLLFTALVAMASTTTTTVSAESRFPESCGYLQNMDRPGDDMGALAPVIAGNSDSCVSHCNYNPKCAAWVWAYGMCYLKSRVGKLVPKAGVTSFNCGDYSVEGVCKPYQDIDFVGMDIGSKPGKTWSDCCDVCSAFPGCTASSWTDFNGGTCWLKSSVGHVLAKQGAVSTSIVKLWGPVCPFEYDVDFEGNDIGNKPAQDAGVCCSLCKGNKDCKAYSWNDFNGGTCWMKSAKGKAVAKTGTISAKLAGF